MTVPNRHLDLINGHLITEPQPRPLRSGDNWRNPRIAAGEIWIVMGEVTGSLLWTVDHLETTHPRYWRLETLKCPSVVNENYLAHHNHQTRKQQVISPRRKQIFRGWGGLFLWFVFGNVPVTVSLSNILPVGDWWRLSSLISSPVSRHSRLILMILMMWGFAGF